MAEEERLYRIAAELRDKGKLNPFMYRVWKLHTDGFTFYVIRQMLRAERMSAELLESDEMKKRERYLGNSASSLKRYYHRAQFLIEEAERDERLIDQLGGVQENVIGYTGERQGDPWFYKDGVLMKFI